MYMYFNSSCLAILVKMFDEIIEVISSPVVEIRIGTKDDFVLEFAVNFSQYGSDGNFIGCQVHLTDMEG